MPFFAVIEAATGDLLDVVLSLDEDLPPGAIAIELPAKDDDLRRWLAQHSRDRGGGAGGDELFLDRTEQHEGDRRGGRREELPGAEHFFARLDHETLRGEVEEHRFAVLLFELATIDRPLAQEFVLDELRRHGQELLPTDLISRLRDHLVGVLLPDVDGSALGITPARGTLTVLTYPADRLQIDLLRRRRHPLLRNAAYRLQHRAAS
jgi:hypothetical protein